MLNVDDLIKGSMKSRNQTELRAYKNLKAEIQAFKTAKNAKPYDEVAEIQLISKMCKKLEDGILGFSEAHRDDLVADYTSELEVLKKLLPEPVNESQICSFVEEYCLNNNFVGNTEAQENIIQIPKKEMGKVIKVVKETYPQADGKLISSIVKKYVI